MTSQTINQLLKEGIAAAKAKNKEQAQELLIQVTELDEDNAVAWLWLSTVVDSLEDKEVCLDNVLMLEPNNEMAKKSLALLKQQKEIHNPPPPLTTTDPLEPIIESPYVAIEYPANAPETSVFDFDDKYMCPYCALKTHPQDKQCKNCNNKLWVKVFQRDKPSWVWEMAIGLQGVVLLGYIVFITLIWSQTYQTFLEIEWFILAPVQNRLTEEAFTLIKNYSIISSISGILFSGFILLGLYLRWYFIFYLYVIFGVFGMCFGMFCFGISLYGAEFLGFLIGGIIFSLTVLLFFTILRLSEDLGSDMVRIVSIIDKGVTNADTLFASGRKYAKQGMWGMAVIHLRRASSKDNRNIDYQVAVAVAYINLKMYDLAEKTLRHIKEIDPLHAQVDELRKLIDRKRNEEWIMDSR